MRSANTLPLNVVCVAVVVDQLSFPLQRGIVNDCECKLMRLLDNLFVLRKKDIYLRPHCALPMRSANTLPLNVVCVAVVVDQLSFPLQRGIVNDCECKLMRLLDNLGRVWVIKR